LPHLSRIFAIGCKYLRGPAGPSFKKEIQLLSRKQRRFKNDQAQHIGSANTIDFNNYRQFNRKIQIIPRNKHQEDYVCSLYDHNKSIIFATGPAGTGKTLIAVLAAVKALKEGDTRKIVLTRPAVEVDGERHGFLPGDLNAKMEPWTKPIFDVLHEHFSPHETAKMLEEQILEISPLAFMRGRTFKHSWIIADEMQNATPSQMKMLLTRLGEDSRMVVTGDVRQTDRKEGDNGLIDFNALMEKFGSSSYIDWIKFDHRDIERHPAVAEVLKIYGDE
jgi:phosphate starvation-inducible PhoH-like protein